MFENRKIKMQIVRFLANECSGEEQRIISELINTDKRYRSIYRHLQRTWHSTRPSAGEETYDVDEAWAKVQNRIDAKQEPVIRTLHPHPIRKIVYAVSGAAAILLIGLGIFQYVRPSDDLNTFASGSAIAVPVNLADGSVIHLNKNSEIKFPEKFGHDNREVYFWGEAFFSIASDKTRPFIINAGETRIKVLGTSFNVKDYEETGKVEVTVKTGSVLFYYVDKDENALGQVTLSVGDKGIYDRKAGRIFKTVNTDLNFMSWKTGILVFDEATLGDVFDAIGNRYGVSFDIKNKQIKNLRLTATFDKDQSLDSVLEVIRLVHSVEFVKTGKDYLVTK